MIVARNGRYAPETGHDHAGTRGVVARVVTIIVLAGLVGKVRGPRAVGIPYVKA